MCLYANVRTTLDLSDELYWVLEVRAALEWALGLEGLSGVAAASGHRLSS